MRAKLIALTLAVLLLASGRVFAVQVSSDGSRGDANRIYTAVLNDSGSTLTSGTVVIWDTGTDDPADDGLGAYITTTTSADDNLVAGVTITSSIVDQGIGTICVYGPVLTLFAGATDSGTEAAGTAVGSTTVAGQAGTGTGLGVILRDDDATGEIDGEQYWIFVNPSNAE